MVAWEPVTRHLGLVWFSTFRLAPPVQWQDTCAEETYYMTAPAGNNLSTLCKVGQLSGQIRRPTLSMRLINTTKYWTQFKAKWSEFKFDDCVHEIGDGGRVQIGSSLPPQICQVSDVHAVFGDRPLARMFLTGYGMFFVFISLDIVWYVCILDIWVLRGKTKWTKKTNTPLPPIRQRLDRSASNACANLRF